ncbi:MAG: hypothetical protein AABZ55_04170 [Bdellovibrionota bacterium]
MINKAIFNLVLAALLACSQALATSFYQRPFSETVQDAPQIARGHIGMTYVDWARSPDGTKRLFTYYELTIDEIIKGTISSKSIQMRELGGEKDGIGMQVAGTAKFTRGEDVVVFLGDKNLDSSYDVRGMMMGKYNINIDEKGQETLVGPGLTAPSGSGIVHDDGHAPGQDDTQVQTTWTMEALRQLVRDQGGGKKPSESGVVSSKIPGLKVTPPKDQGGVNRSPPGAAPGLQPTIVEERNPPQSGLLNAFTLALIGTGIFLAWLFFRLLRNKKRR